VCHSAAPERAIGAVALIGACVALWFKAEAADERAKDDRGKLLESERAMAVLRAQTTAATAVADALREERDKDRAAARQTVQGINNAPIDQNRVVPGALPLAIGELRKSAGQ
jgi:hypothetical protein